MLFINSTKNNQQFTNRTKNYQPFTNITECKYNYFHQIHLHSEPKISAKHFHQQHLSAMACTKKNDLTDGAVIPLPQSSQPPSPSQSTAARVASVATSVLPSPSKTTDITADAPHDNAFLVEPNLEEVNYEEEEEDNREDEEDKDRDYSPNKFYTKATCLIKDINPREYQISINQQGDEHSGTVVCQGLIQPTNTNAFSK